jgi:UMP-CMP kinase
MEERLIKRGETSGREDDNAETIKKRFHTFTDKTMPVIEYADKQGKLKKVRINNELPNHWPRSNIELFMDELFFP